MSDLPRPESDLDTVLAQMARLPAREAAEVARADQEARWRSGDRVPAERYLDALPHVAASPEDALVVVYGELLLGGPPDLARFRQRYPHLAEQLNALGEVHHALAGLSETTTGPTVGPSAGTEPGVQPPDPFPGEFRLLRPLGEGAFG